MSGRCCRGVRIVETGKLKHVIGHGVNNQLIETEENNDINEITLTVKLNLTDNTTHLILLQINLQNTNSKINPHHTDLRLVLMTTLPVSTVFLY